MYGVLGGKGNADGKGQAARFNYVSNMVGDDEYLYLVDGWREDPAFAECVGKHCWDEIKADTGAACILEKCWLSPAPKNGVRLVRHLMDWSGGIPEPEVKWLATDLAARHLAFDGAELVASTAAPVRWSVVPCEPALHYDGCVQLQRPPAQAIVRIDRETGAVSALAGTTVQGAPHDGFGDGARFGSISGLASAGAGVVYITEPRALRRLEVATGQVTTLVAAPDWPGEKLSEAPFVQLGPVTVSGSLVYAVDNGAPEPKFGKLTLWKYDPATEELTADTLSGSFSVESLCFNGLEMIHLASGCLKPFSDCTGPSSIHGLWCGHDFWDCYYADALSSTINVMDYADRMSFPIAGKGKATFDEFANGVLNPLSLAADSGGGVTVFVRTSDANGTSLRPVKDGCCQLVKLFHVRGGTTVELNLPLNLTLAAPRAVAGPERTLYFVASDAPHSGPLIAKWTLWKLSLESGELKDLGIEVSASDVIAHDGVAALWVYGGGEQIERIEEASNEREVRPIVVPAGCGPVIASGSRMLMGCGRTAGAAWPEAHGLESFESIWRDAPGTFFPTLVEIDLQSSETRVLATPPDGWMATALAYDPSGTLYVAEASRQRVRAMTLRNEEVFDVAGGVGIKGVQPGPLPASLNQPIDIAVLPDGSLAIADFGENVVLVAR